MDWLPSSSKRKVIPSVADAVKECWCDTIALFQSTQQFTAWNKVRRVLKLKSTFSNSYIDWKVICNAWINRQIKEM